MDEHKSVEQKSEAQKIAERREFLKKAGKIAVTAPAVALLLSATRKAHATDVVSGINLDTFADGPV
jgi:hypothetical protein